ncbi:MAG: MFS transporter [Bordetella sp.]|uniref:MFS transporter n=1 Tax=Bordetella sp. TaxID=28081 RepID=UPI003F7C6743
MTIARDSILRKLLNGLHRRPVLELTCACLGVLLLAQALIGALSLSALNRLATDTVADRAEVAAQRIVGNIQNGLRLGKPLGQFFGLNEILRDGMADASGARGVAVVLADGRVLESAGQTVPEAAELGRALAGVANAEMPAGMMRRGKNEASGRAQGEVVLAVPLFEDKAVAGAVVLAIEQDAAASRALIVHNLLVLFLATALVGFALAVVFKWIVPPAQLTEGGRARFAVPLAALLLAQGIYAASTITTFRDTSLRVAHDSVAAAAAGLQRDLDRVLGYGIAPDRLRGVDVPFRRLAGYFPNITAIDLIDVSGRVLDRANARGAQPVDGLARTLPVADALTLVLPLSGGSSRANLVVHLDDRAIAAQVRSRMLDAATVVVVSVVAAVEMLLLLSLLMSRAYAVRALGRDDAPRRAQDMSDVGRIARPVMFGFLFAWALPLGFLPLYARSLSAEGLHLRPAMLMALPISVEMACGLIASLLAGSLTDRKGWQVPVLTGLGISLAAFVACAAAPDLPWFVAARGLVGLGYGLTWMGLQGFVVTGSPAASRGRNMTGLVAGLFAGHMAGAAVGAMLMEQLGFRSVFVVGAAMLILPCMGVLVLMRPYMVRVEAHAARVAAPARVRLSAMLKLLATRDFGLLLLGSVIPFSVAQVGLLSFALPLYLEAQGSASSSVGRVLMIYGVCVIYVGPLMGRLADRFAVKKYWIVAGGVVGSLGLLGLYFDSGLLAAALAVLTLALASCCTGAAQTPYMLALSDVQDYGVAGATSVLRAADKLGQMAGPLVVGVLFGAHGLGLGLALTGGIYLAATVLFLLFAPALRARGALPSSS